MKRAIAIALVSVGLVGPALAGAGGKMVGQSAPEIDAQYWLNARPLSLASLRGKVVVVEFWATWCPPCRRSIPHLVEMHKKFGGKGVVIVSLTDEPRRTVEPFARQMGMNYAVGGGSRTGRAYGVRGIPRAFVVDPAGTIVWEGHPMGGLDAAIEKQIKKTPPSMMSPKEKAAALALVERVERALKEKKYARAAGLLAKVPRPDDDPEVKKRADAARGVLRDVSEKRLAEADALLKQKQYYEASVALDEVIGLARGSEQVKKARDQLKSLMADKKIRPVIEQGRREHQAALMLGKIEKDEKKMTPGGLLAALENAAAKFPSTKAGNAAAQRAARMRADTDLMKRIEKEAADADCKGWLSMARNYINAGHPGKARPYLERVLENYPHTPYAEEAGKLLAEIGD